MDRTSVQDWLDRYVEAWKTYDPDLVVSLFAEDATYRYHPYDPETDVLRGREAIVRDWIEPQGNAANRDQPGTYDGKYEVFAIDGDRAVATGWSRYWTDATRTTLEQTYDNVYLLRFDGDGRCTAFTEYFMAKPAAAG
jgi:ketosteroid isomerase-like protein